MEQDNVKEEKFFLTGLTAEQHAVDMADLFESNLRFFGGEPYVTDEGLDALADYFNGVEIDLRGTVFECFQEELKDRGIEFEPEMFQ